MQQGITKTQPKGKLGKVGQQPVTCEWLTIASMSHKMRSQQRLLIGGCEVKHRFGSPLEFAKALRMSVSKVSL